MLVSSVEQSKTVVHIHVGGGSLVAKSCPTLAAPWIAGHQTPLSMEFSRRECWGGLSVPSLIHIHISTLF